MPTNPTRAASVAAARDDAHRRMLAARDHIRRWFSPEAIENTDLNAPEVIGIRDGSNARDIGRVPGT